METLLGIAWRELTVFAAVGFAIGGLDDLAVDLLWIGRSAWRRVFIFTRYNRATSATLPPPTDKSPLVVFVPAWHESDVIAEMLVTCLHRWRKQNFQIFVGCYPNDPATRWAVVDGPSLFVRLVECPRPGPTTKADCLNTMWQALLADEEKHGFRAKAVILHDAEDLVHAEELTVYASLIERFEMVQLPVEPLPDPKSRWVAGHYLDEFAEAHSKDLVVREAVGASVPSAGVGCAIRRDALQQLADEHGGLPFDIESLTEDYELGLKFARYGFRCAFARVAAANGEGLVAVRAHFPGSLDTAVRQKSRWITGIALAGWDRLGWQGNWIERWMRLRDRRAILAAIILTAGYAALALFVLAYCFKLSLPPLPNVLSPLIGLCGLLFIWRALVRLFCVSRLYGFAEGLRSLLRIPVANLIAIAAARRAVVRYVSYLRSGDLSWEKTTHIFPKTGGH
jgi:adsorption protein B